MKMTLMLFLKICHFVFPKVSEFDEQSTGLKPTGGGQATSPALAEAPFHFPRLIELRKA